jgi:hypothetical protein
MKKLLLMLIPVFLLFYSGKQNKTAGNGDFYVINCEKAFSNSRVFRLSEAASNLDYIKLETNENCLVGSRAEYFFTDDFIFVQNRDHVLKFSRDGKFLKKIGKPGKGPGEIDMIRAMTVIPQKKQIVVQPLRLRKLYHFSFDGDLVKTEDFNSPGSSVMVCPDGKYVTYDMGFSGKEDFTFSLMNDSWDTLSNVRNHQKWVNTSGRILAVSYPSFKPFYYSGGNIYFKSMYNDTVFSISGNRIKPAYYVNMGKYALPFELRPEKLGENGIQQFHDNSQKYHFASALESGGLIFISADCYGKAPAKYVIYDTKTKQASLAELPDREPGGILNDWDGVMDFWPGGKINEKQVFRSVNVVLLKKIFERNRGVDNAKHPETRMKLQEMVEAADISDNPVLTVVTLK